MFVCIIQVLFFPPSVSAVVVLSVSDAVVRFRRNKRQQPGKETDKNYNTAQQDAEKRKEHADKGLDRRFGEETMMKTSSAKPEPRDSLSKYL